MITLVYFLPVILVAWRAWNDASTSEKNAHKGAISRFYDMIFYIFLKSAMGMGGIILAIIIHFQMYMLVFVMMWCASHIKDISDKVLKLKDEQAGTYQGVELRGGDDHTERKALGGAGAENYEIALAEDKEQEPAQIEEEH